MIQKKIQRWRKVNFFYYYISSHCTWYISQYIYIYIYIDRPQEILFIYIDNCHFLCIIAQYKRSSIFTLFGNVLCQEKLSRESDIIYLIYVTHKLETARKYQDEEKKGIILLSSLCLIIITIIRYY